MPRAEARLLAIEEESSLVVDLPDRSRGGCEAVSGGEMLRLTSCLSASDATDAGVSLTAGFSSTTSPCADLSCLFLMISPNFL